MACSLLESDLERAQPQMNKAVIFIPKERGNQLARLSYIESQKREQVMIKRRFGSEAQVT